MREHPAKISALVQLVLGLLLGGLFLRVLQHHGWASHWTLWTAIGILGFALASVFGEVRARLSRLEGRVRNESKTDA